MANVKVYNMSGAEVGEIELNDAVFGVEINEHVMHLAVKQYLANQRQGTQSAKTRSEVSGGGRKPSDRKEQAVQDRVQSVLPSGKAAALYLLPSPEITHSSLTKRLRNLLYSQLLHLRLLKTRLSFSKTLILQK